MTSPANRSRVHTILKPGAPMYGIQRVAPRLSADGGHWCVTMQRDGHRFEANFIDSRYQGDARALEAAQAFRDALLARLPKALDTLAPTAGSDKVGVYRMEKLGKSYWCARFRFKRKAYCKLFNIARYGDEPAQQLALAARTAWEKEHGLDNTILRMPSKAEVDRIAQTVRKHFGETPAPTVTRAPFHEDAMYGITRLEANAAGKRGAWLVRIMRRSKEFGRRFGDLAYGGREAAFAAAQQYRDAVLATLEPTLKRDRHQVLLKNNKSGIPGVRVCKKNGQPKYWAATIVIQGKLYRQAFSIAQYGDAKAFELAAKARKKMLKKVDGYSVFSPAAKMRLSSLNTSHRAD